MQCYIRYKYVKFFQKNFKKSYVIKWRKREAEALMAEEKAIQNLPLPQPYLQPPTTKQLLKLGNPFIVPTPTHNNKTYWIFLTNSATLSLLHRDRQRRIPSPVE